jgi:hypothetical protein
MLPRFCSGRLLRRAFFAFSAAAVLANAQTTHEPAAKKTETRRVNELTLARLRPGRDTVDRALRLYRRDYSQHGLRDSQVSWSDECHHQRLSLDVDGDKKVQIVRVLWLPESEPTTCKPIPPPPTWNTGAGLRIYDSAQKLAQLYGNPDSKSPSTRDGQPLELWYYAFDWAGPDVPQVMEVLCTREQNGQPGRVIEITLAAPSL